MDLELVAHHEAGHAVAAHAVGIEGVVELRSGEVFAGRFRWTGLGHLCCPYARALVALAGPEAERRYRARGRPWSPEARIDLWWPSWVRQNGDRGTDLKLALSVPDGSPSEARWWALVWATADLGEALEPAVEIVAAVLRTQGSLTADEIAGLCEATPGWGDARALVEHEWARLAGRAPVEV